MGVRGWYNERMRKEPHLPSLVCVRSSARYPIRIVISEFTSRRISLWCIEVILDPCVSLHDNGVCCLPVLYYDWCYLLSPRKTKGQSPRRNSRLLLQLTSFQIKRQLIQWKGPQLEGQSSLQRLTSLMSSDTVFIVIFTSFASSPSSNSDPFCFTIPSLVIDDHFNVLIDFEFCGSYDIFAKKFVALDEASETTRVVSITVRFHSILNFHPHFREKIVILDVASVTIEVLSLSSTSWRYIT